VICMTWRWEIVWCGWEFALGPSLRDGGIKRCRTTLEAGYGPCEGGVGRRKEEGNPRDLICLGWGIQVGMSCNYEITYFSSVAIS
jgi:hypothetical protein